MNPCDLQPYKILRKPLILWGFLCFCTVIATSQDQAIVDSLEPIYINQEYEVQDRLKILKSLSVQHTDPKKSLSYSLELIETARSLDSLQYLFTGYLQKGNSLRVKGDLSEALESYFVAAKIAKQDNSERDLGIINITIADVYSIMGNNDNAILYYQKAIQILRKEKDSIGLASALLNTGDEYINQGKPTAALVYFEESGEIFRKVAYKKGVAYNLGNVGLAYALLARNTEAEENINQAIEILTELGDFYPICVYLSYMSDIYVDKKDDEKALYFVLRSLNLAKEYGLKDQISDANLKISELYERAGDTITSYKYYKNHITYKDSVNNISSVQQMANVRTDFEVSQKQLEVDLLNQQKRNQKIISVSSIIAFILIALLTLGLYRRYNYIQKTKRIIENERNRSDKLLRNILPEQTATELKENGKVAAKKFTSVSVLFTDFEGFTRSSENLRPEDLVKSVDFYYSKFDEIIASYGMEKIKTIGDAYMCAGGLPFPDKDHYHKVIQAAIDISHFVFESKASQTEEQARFDVRIGIHTGTVVAGVVGTNKFAYDIWGDTVNIASRMESSSVAGKINISETTYELIKDKFECEYRGEIIAKNKGKMKMYFVRGLK